jgi:hypothetical protein
MIQLHVALEQQWDRLGILGDCRKWFSEGFGRHLTMASTIK